ncbi:MAG: hypothetical protein E7422_08230 [Ruminococcaceae bacterium]|nr:hypothetical protein [Oscillospiraceae bacterium]
MAKKVTDEKLLEMLLVCGGTGGAASALGISRNAIYKRLQDPVFRSQYEAAQGIILSAAAASLTAALDDAVGCLRDVMGSCSASPAIKIQAANAILTHCNRYVESANIVRRLDELEEAADNA